MGQISDIKNPWRKKLLGKPASFRRVMFHVESGTVSSGRRTVVHEYPKRDDNYSEDMGRAARRWQFTGYLIYKPSAASGKRMPGIPLPPVTGSSLEYDYVKRREELKDALDQEDAATLIHPVFAPGGILVMCDRYSMTETRERGGYTAFEMSFVFAGTAGNSATSTNTTAATNNQAAATEKTATTSFNASGPGPGAGPPIRT